MYIPSISSPSILMEVILNLPFSLVSFMESVTERVGSDVMPFLIPRVSSANSLTVSARVSEEFETIRIFLLTSLIA